MSYLSCRALHSKIINKRRLMLKTNDVRISDCSLLLHASLKCVCSGNGPTPPPPSIHPLSALQLRFCCIFFLSYFAQGGGLSICIGWRWCWRKSHRLKDVPALLLRLLSVSVNCRPNWRILSARFPTVDSALKPTPQKNEKKYDWLWYYQWEFNWHLIV